MSIFSQKTQGQGDQVVQPAYVAPTSGPKPAKRIANGTLQQESLWAELVDGTANLVAEARAGSGKSSSCREAMWRVLERKPRTLIRYAVFNSVNAKEFKEDCPSQVDVGTVHSFGYASIKRAFGSRLEKNKTYLILDESQAGRNLPRYMRKSIAMLVGHAKNQNLRPDQPELQDVLRDLMVHFDVNGYGRPFQIIDLAAKVLERSATWCEIVDFDDMIWLPIIHQTEFPNCDLLFLDEVQDWNPTQHALVPLLCKSGRVCAVGDRHQAIYAWRGADVDSIPKLERILGASAAGVKSLPLTITFRCPKSHIRLAQEFVPDIEAHESNAEGTIANLGNERALAEMQPGDMAICPLNAPLVSAALQLIRQRRRAFVRGRGLGDQLIAVIRGCGDCRTIADLARAVDQWRGRELSRLSELEGVDDLIESVQDRASGLQAIISGCAQPNEVEPTIQNLFSEEVKPNEHCVVFSTIHRAKGLEAHRVWYLDVPTRAPKQDWEARQAMNLRYVGCTRSKNELTFVE